MAKFRKRPIVIEAEQWFLGKQVKGVYGETEAQSGGNGLSPQSAMAFVTTIHGQKTRVVEGDWIIPEPDGKHFYPVKPDIFEATYERVTE